MPNPQARTPNPHPLARLIAALALMTLVACTTQPTPTPLPPLPPAPSPPAPTRTPASYQPIINITRAEYEAALDQWQSQGITEYEEELAEISLAGGSWVFMVNGNQIEKLRDAAGSYTLTPQPIDEYYQSFTIDGLFAAVRTYLDKSKQSFVGQWVYNVVFDPVYGYPQAVKVDCDIGCPTDMHWFWRVQQFTILKNGTPILPLSPTPTPQAAFPPAQLPTPNPQPLVPPTP